METYVVVSFWMAVIGLVINMLCIIAVDYPKQRTETLGFKVAQVLIGAGFAAWSGFLVFWS